MRANLLVTILAAVAFWCGEARAQEEAADTAVMQALMQKNGCFGCHALDKKIVGPAYRDIAARYKNDRRAPAKLMYKLKKGGSGVWGDTPMPPAGENIDPRDLKTIITWILSL